MRHLIAGVAAVAALALPATAMATPYAVLRDCADNGSLDGSHSDADKREALRRIPADVDEYSDCRSVIAASIGGPTAGASSKDGGGSGGSAAAKADAKKAAKQKEADKRKRKRRATELALGNRTIDPRSAGVLNAADTENGLSLPILLALIALGLLGLSAALLGLSKRNPALAGALRRVPIPRPRR